MQTAALTIGTRGSPLALAQAREVRARICASGNLDETEIAIQVIHTSGDRIQDRPLSEVGGKGLFTKEIEQALLDGRIDLAVHSSKDMPTRLPDGLELSAFLCREDPRDAFLSPSVSTLFEMPDGATIGTSSLRRQALVHRARPDLVVVEFRGNVQTRLRKLDDGVASATLLALAGLRRLGMEDAATAVLPLDVFPPAPGQGAICIETRIGDRKTLEWIEALHDAATGHALACERAFLEVLDGSCRTPIAGHAALDGQFLQFFGMILTPDGVISHDIVMDGKADDASEIGYRAGEAVRAKAGAGFFESWT